MARSTYKVTGTSPKSLAAMLRDLPAVTRDELEDGCAQVCEAGKRAAEEACPSSFVSFETRRYRSDGGDARLVASGPSVKGKGYSYPLVKLLEYGTGIVGDPSYAKGHGYVVNLSGKGESGWDVLIDGEWRHIHGTRAHKFMARAADAMREEAARQAEAISANAMRRSGL